MRFIFNEAEKNICATIFLGMTAVGFANVVVRYLQHYSLASTEALLTNGFLLLTGPDDDPAQQNTGWTVVWWDGKHTPDTKNLRTLAALDLSGVTLRPCDKEIKPDALAVLGETPQTYTLLVLSDGVCDGGPLRFTVPR